MTYLLYARKAWGSVITEAALTLAGLEFEITGPRGEKAKGIPTLKSVNPLGQYPTLVCPDGWVMTESAAILFHIDDVAPKAGLVPSKRMAERRQFLKILQVINGNIYPTFTYADYPARFVSSQKAREELMDSTRKRRCSIWKQIEKEIQADPWMLGRRFSGLDLYAAAMSRWGPGRSWFEKNCPNVMSAANAAWDIDVLKPVWERNFG